MNPIHRFLLRNRIKPLTAAVAMHRLLRDPDDTSQVFQIVESLSGDTISRPVKRLRADAQGSALLASKPDIVQHLNDRALLAAMPEGSIGRAYYNFVHGENLSADGLIASSKVARDYSGFSEDERWTADRLRDIHDLQHVMTGYGRDPVGELSLLAFMTTQVPNRGIDFIIRMARRKYRKEMPDLDIDQLLDEGRQLGQQAAWMPAIPWEQRLAQPLERVRNELGFQPPQHYRTAQQCQAELMVMA